MLEQFNEIVGPFGGDITEAGKAMAAKLADKFADCREVTFPEMLSFLKGEGVEYPAMAIVLGGGEEMMQQGLGFIPWYDNFIDSHGEHRYGWVGFVKP